MEILHHGGCEKERKVDTRWVDSERLLDRQRWHDELHEVDGVIIPGGFGDRGIEGMIQAAQYARENGLPCFGICLGMQVIVMEYARNVLGYADANSSEFTPDGAHNVIALMPDQPGKLALKHICRCRRLLTSGSRCAPHRQNEQRHECINTSRHEPCLR